MWKVERNIQKSDKFEIKKNFNYAKKGEEKGKTIKKN